MGSPTSFHKDPAGLPYLASPPRAKVPDSGIICDLLWADPDSENHTLGWGENERGVSYTFGPDIVTKFLAAHDLDLICRAHQVVENGYEFFARRQLVTVFSAPNYCDQFGNKGCYAVFDHTCKPKYNSFAHVPHPKVPPMAYASPMMAG